MKKILYFGVLLGLLTGCSENGSLVRSWGGDYNANETGGYYKVGTPYRINGQWYYPKPEENYTEKGQASWYEDDFSGSGVTANGEKFSPLTMTAAHRTLPLPSLVRVTNLENGLTAIVRVNDRGPFVSDRIIDVSKRTAEILEFHDKGTTKVEVTLLPDETKEIQNVLIADGYVSKDEGTVESLKNPIIRPISEENLEPISLVKEIPEAETEEEIKPMNSSSEQIIQVPSSGYFVQFGAFSQSENAEALKNQLSSLKDVHIRSKNVNGKMLYFVLMGPYSTRNEVDEKSIGVRNSGFTDFFIKTGF